MERSANQNRLEAPVAVVEIVGPALDHLHVGDSGRHFAGDGQHLGLGVHGHRLGHMGGEGFGELAGAAAEVQHPVLGRQADQLDHPGDQGLRIGRAAGEIVGGGGLEPAVFKVGGRLCGHGLEMAYRGHLMQPLRSWGS